LTALAARVPEATWVVAAPEHLASWVQGQLGSGSSVVVRATRSPGEYNDVLAQLDATVGTMALDRRGLTEAAPLKVRDAAARGIPLLLPYVDTNLDAADDPAVLRIDPRAIDRAAASVRNWLPRISGRRLSDATRSLVDIHVIERRRLDFLAGLTR
jgi:hypothetical protein